MWEIKCEPVSSILRGHGFTPLLLAPLPQSLERMTNTYVDKYMAGGWQLGEKEAGGDGSTGGESQCMWLPP